MAKPLFAKLAAMKLNTVLVPVSWELVEPAEGKWSFGLVGDLIREARRHKLRVVLLWFGSWKNGMSSYVPAWVKTNPERFPRAEVKGGRRVEALSAFAPANMQADARAFTELMRYVRTVDGRDHTVIMVQVENEVAMIDESADRSAAARAAFAGAGAEGAARALPRARSARDLGAGVRARASATEELFMAWHYARLRRGGRARRQDRVPAADADERGAQPAGQEAGRVPERRAAAAPVRRLEGGRAQPRSAGARHLLSRLRHLVRPLRAARQPAVHSRGEERSATPPIHALYAVGRGALGFSPFAIESTAEAVAAALTKSYVLLAELAPLHRRRRRARPPAC